MRSVRGTTRFLLRRGAATQAYDDRAQLEHVVACLDKHEKQESSVYARALHLCGKLRCIREGKRVHDQVVADGLEDKMVIGNNLVSMYSKCGSLEDAWNVFHRMKERNVVTWTTMISAYAQHGYGRQAMLLFQDMVLQGMNPDQYTFNILLNISASMGAIREGKVIHTAVVESGLESDLIVGNSLVNMYGKCGCVAEAYAVFRKMRQRNVVSWTAVIAAYAMEGHFEEALELFKLMQLEGSPKPNNITFVVVLDACRSLAEGESIYAQVAECGYESDVLVGTALLDFLGKCGSWKNASDVFEKMHQRTFVSWTAMIAAFAQCGHIQEALQVYQKMQQEGVKPNSVTLVTLVGASSVPLSLVEGHIAESGLNSDALVGNALISMYAKCERLEDARKAFDRISEKDMVSWNTMIAAYAQEEYSLEALELFRHMRLEGIKPNEYTFVAALTACTGQAFLAEGDLIHKQIVHCGHETDVVWGALIYMYGKCKSLDCAFEVFDKMPRQCLSSWNTLTAVCVQHGDGKEAFRLYRRMKLQGVIPDTITYISVLDACASGTDLAEGKRIHADIAHCGFGTNVAVENALLDMYGKCGNLEDAEQMFTQMGRRNVISWTAMIAIYAQHGHWKQALQLFERMQQAGVKPNPVTFTSVLFACSHAGLVDKGYGYFASLRSEHAITPTEDHYTCMVDLLGRAGRLGEAEELISRIPCQPGATNWMTLLSSCRNLDDVERGKRAADTVLQSDSNLSGAYVVLSNMYAAATVPGAMKLQQR